MPVSLLVILCNRTSPSERLGHVILVEVHSSLGQTSALHVFRDYVVISLVYGQRNTNRTVIC